MPGFPGDHSARAVQLVGHAGLAIHRAGGSPTRRDLDEALAMDVDRLELDVCATADGSLVMRHDVTRDDGRLVADLDLAELRRVDSSVLTIDDLVEHVGDSYPLLIDIKMARAADLLGIWLRGRGDLGRFALCTEKLPWLLHLRFAAPRVARWPSFPDLGERSTHHVQRVVVGLWRSHASVSGLRRGVGDVHRAATQLRHRPQESLARLAGLPWRGRLPLDLTRIVDDVNAEGVCVQHWVVSEHLVEEGHRAGLHVNAWTVNNPFAARVVAAAGVDSITTDRIDMVRRALRSQSRPERRTPPRAQLRVAARSSLR
jgi:glycerophosphoryl diester phosphodiesterase